MSAYRDLAYDDDETTTTGAKSVRMEQRTTEQAKELIEKAASLVGLNASEFTVAAATRAARATLREFQGTVLTAKDHAAFMQALEATEPTTDLKALMSFGGKVASAE